MTDKEQKASEIKASDTAKDITEEALDDAQGGLLSLNLNTNFASKSIFQLDQADVADTNNLVKGQEGLFKLRTRPGRG